ncbi:S-adenosyl-L-methionine-dependent methyltransferase [Lentinus tigrinus ALCF2SS1-6]|uniref:S-adenosyl-L-methionine-dependent methyltransferase n=1 Tax=Lentinus tigrinus ALCF2SS1-6 TaxID=1328759 RepID=A0A5C2RXA3_9APHY|nr:S-adenosyl-L-methionine-dependent methyltransferase [Lentinus tigrinus ALCF2SS1-6]
MSEADRPAATPTSAPPSGTEHEHEHEHKDDDFAAANKAYFDAHADKVEEMHPEWRAATRKQVDAMRAEWPGLFDGERTAALDFACGIGLVSEALLATGYVKSVVGVDISQASVDRYNALAARLEYAPEKMKAVCAELKGDPDELDGAKFDIVVVRTVPLPFSPSTTVHVGNELQCCASYHHIASIDATTRVLASFLKPGGSLLITDLKAEADNRELVPEAHHSTVPHTRGIAEARLRETFKGAGLGEFVMKDAGQEDMTHWGRERVQVTWFVARGVKPAQ